MNSNSHSTYPAGFGTVFFTELWERFSYYGMRALLVLFMTSTAAAGGLGYDDATATAIYGLYTAAVYLTSLPGGWLADRFLGARSAVWWGGIIIMLGHFTLAIPGVPTFYLGLLLVALGTGLLKPNVSALVGALYADRSDAARDGGYTLYYMAINLGAMLGPIVCSGLGESARFGWHYGFAAAGVGMLLGLIQFRLGHARFGSAGDSVYPDARSAVVRRRAAAALAVTVVVTAAVFTAVSRGVIRIDPVALAQASAWIILGAVVAYFAWLYSFGNLDAGERKRVHVILVLVLAVSLFWSGFEQTGSSLTLFAERYTDRMVGGFEIPTGWFQSVNPLFILLLAPFAASLWINLGRRNLDPSIPSKFAVGLAQLGAGFLVMWAATLIVVRGETVAPAWLLLTYLLHTTGELCISPVGLSAISRLAPARYVSQLMGIWFTGTALGNLLAGLLAGRFDPEALSDMPGLYLEIGAIGFAAAAVMLALRKPMQRWSQSKTDSRISTTR